LTGYFAQLVLQKEGTSFYHHGLAKPTIKINQVKQIIMNKGNNPIPENPIFGYACHKFIFDENKKPVDFEFLEINQTFEKLTGLKRENLIGRKVLEAIPEVEKGEFDWIRIYGKIALDGGEDEFEQYFELSGKWCRVHVCSTDKITFTATFIDITKSKKQIEELEAFFSVNLDLLCIADIDGNFIKTNEAWSRILGYSTDDLNKRKFLEFVHPDDLQLTLDALAKLGNGNDVLNFTNRFRTNDGSYRNIEWLAHPVGNMIYAAARDITGRKKSEQDLLHSQELNRKLLTTIPDIVVQTNLDGVITFVNDPEFTEYPFIKINNVLGRSVFSLIAPKDLERAIDNARLMFEKPLGIKEYTLCFDDGQTLECEVNGDVIRDADNNPTGMVYVIRDVTKRKNTDQALKESESRNRALLEAIPDFMFVINKKGYLVDYNITNSSDLLLPPEEFLNKHVLEVLPYEMASLTLVNLDNAFQTMQTQMFEYQLEIKGLLKHFEARIVYSSENTALSIIRNITDQKEAVLKMRRSESIFAEINDCLVNLGSDYNLNVNDLTALCGRLLGATCALYNRLDDYMLCSLGQWSTPEGYNPVDKPDGHICFDVIKSGNREPVLIKNLQATKYAETDPNVSLYSLKTYAGHPVFSGGEAVGSLCVVYQTDKELDLHEQGVLCIIAAALGSEEQRLRDKKALLESESKNREMSTLFRLMTDNMPDLLWAKNLNKEYIFANKAICNNLLNATDTEEPIGKTDMFFANRERNSHPEKPDWHSFGEICRDSDAITLEEMRSVQFDEFGNVKGKFLFLDVHKAPLLDGEGKLIGVVGSARDVTAAKETENQLRKLSQAVEQSPSSVVITNLKGNIEYVNPKFTEVTGYTREEVKGKNSSILKSGEQPEEHYKQLWETITSGREWRGEFLNKKKTGELYWESASVTPIKNEKGETTHYLSVTEDVTEQKQAQERIRITRDTYQSIFNSVSDAIYVHDENGIFIDVNLGVEKMYGYTRADLIGKSPANISAPGLNDLHALGEIIHNVSETGVSRSLEFWGVRKNGEVFPKDVIINKGTYFGNECIIATARDITERKKLDEDLKYQARLRDLLMEVSSGFINIPLENLDKGVYSSLEKMALFVNADRCYIFDYDWINNVCDNTYEWCAPDINSEISNLQKLPIHVMGETPESHKKGEPEYIPDVSAMTNGPGRMVLESQGIKSFLTVPMMNEQNCIGFVGFDYVRKHHIYSVSEMQLLKIFAQMLVNVKLRKEMVGQLVIAKEKAEESNRLKTHFMNNISHEIRTPLVGLLGFGSFMMKDNLTETEKHLYYEKLELSSARLIKTVDDIMDIAQLKAGSINPKLKDVDVGLIMQNLTENLQNACSNKNILVSLKVPSDQPIRIIQTDEILFTKIITQLISNAEKFTTAGRITLGYEVNNNLIKFFVKDTGKGIATEKLEILFEPFMQEDIRNTRGYEGSGLGLAIAKGMTELLGGQIWAESKKEEGSIFFFTLPIISGTIATSAESDKAVKDKKQGRKLILIAEDDETNFLLLDAVAKKSGFSTLHAWNGAEAVEICHLYPEISLIFMDIKMPTMNGLKATANIKAFRPDVPIIAITAYAQTGDKYKMLEAGCDAYLAKPFRLSELNALIKKLSNQ
jgi:PAS domain S-box-containing protein